MKNDYDNGRLVPKRDFNLIARGFEVRPLVAQLRAHPELWETGRDYRTVSRFADQLSPHRESQDIWVRHQKYETLGDYATASGRDSIMTPAISEWYPESLKLPAIYDMAANVCMGVGAIQLGGIFVIKIDAKKKVYPHSDLSWHSTYYSKYMVVLKAQEGTTLGWTRSGVLIPETGDLWKFENETDHWVYNDSDDDMLIAIFSIRTFNMDKQEAVNKLKGE